MFQLCFNALLLMQHDLFRTDTIGESVLDEDDVRSEDDEADRYVEMVEQIATGLEVDTRVEPYHPFPYICEVTKMCLERLMLDSAIENEGHAQVPVEAVREMAISILNGEDRFVELGDHPQGKDVVETSEGRAHSLDALASMVATEKAETVEELYQSDLIRQWMASQGVQVGGDAERAARGGTVPFARPARESRTSPQLLRHGQPPERPNFVRENKLQELNLAEFAQSPHYKAAALHMQNMIRAAVIGVSSQLTFDQQTRRELRYYNRHTMAPSFNVNPESGAPELKLTLHSCRDPLSIEKWTCELHQQAVSAIWNRLSIDEQLAILAASAAERLQSTDDGHEAEAKREQVKIAYTAIVDRLVAQHMKRRPVVSRRPVEISA